MPENSIGILPNNGYRCLDKTSFPACLWLEWVERRERKYAKEQRQSIEVFKPGIISNDKAKEGEQRLGPCKVDGLLVYKDDQMPNLTELEFQNFSAAIIMDVRSVIRTD